MSGRDSVHFSTIIIINSEVKKLLGWPWHDLLPQTQPRGNETTRWQHLISSSMTSHKHPRLRAWRQLIPTCIQRLGLAEWPKWQQSSWPWRCRSVEWFLLCPCGHRGLVEMGCFLRGHLAALCSYPSNTGIGISTWFGGGSVMESRKILYKVMMDHMHACRWHITCMHPLFKEFQCLPTFNIACIALSVGGRGYQILTIITNFTHSGWAQTCAAEPSNPDKKNEV